MKKHYLWLLLVACSISAQGQVQNYFFKDGHFYRYICFPGLNVPQERKVTLEYYGYTPVIWEKTEMWIKGDYCSSTITYAYDVSQDIVESTGQIYSTILGTKTKRNDRLTILALPSSRPHWVEYNKGEKYDCASNWVYVSYQTNEGESVVAKAIRISKTTMITIKGKSINSTEFSYWTEADARIATCGYWDTTKEICVIELASFISTYPRIKEVSEKEYKAYLSEKAKREAEKERARKEKQYQEFVRNLKPQSLEKSNKEAASKIESFFLQLEQQRYEKLIREGLSKWSGYSELYIEFPTESELHIEAPEDEKDTIASFISDLMRTNILQLPVFVTEPATGRKCEVLQFLKIKKYVNVVSYTFDVVKQKDSWRMANKKESMPAGLATYIIQAANNVYAINRKAKKQQVNLRTMNMVDGGFKVWHVETDPTNPKSAKYTCLDSIEAPSY